MYKHTGEHYRAEMYRLLTDIGYTLFRVAGDSNYRSQQLSETDMGNWRHFDIFCVPEGR